MRPALIRQESIVEPRDFDTHSTICDRTLAQLVFVPSPRCHSHRLVSSLRGLSVFVPFFSSLFGPPLGPLLLLFSLFIFAQTARDAGDSEKSRAFRIGSGVQHRPRCPSAQEGSSSAVTSWVPLENRPNGTGGAMFRPHLRRHTFGLHVFVRPRPGVTTRGRAPERTRARSLGCACVAPQAPATWRWLTDRSYRGRLATIDAQSVCVRGCGRESVHAPFSDRRCRW